MAGPVIQLIPITEFDEDMLVALDRNFRELVRLLGQLQVYENLVGKPTNTKVTDVLTPEGLLQTSKLNEKMVGLENELQLAQEAVTEDKIQVGAVTANKVNVNELSAITAYLGTIISGTITGTTIRSLHPDGSYTQMDANGLLRFIAETGESYHYLIEIGTGVIPSSSSLYDVVVTLPAKFQDRLFKVIVSITQEPGRSYCWVQSYNYAAGQFTVRGYGWRNRLDYQEYVGYYLTPVFEDVGFAYVAIV